MKYILTVLVSLLVFTSCDTTKPTNVTKTVDTTNPVKIEKLIDQVDQGLSKVTLNDSTVILIYRGVESCTMLQLK